MHTTSDGRGRMAIRTRRREFIFALGGAAVAWPLAARAEPKTLRVGAVSSQLRSAGFWQAFEKRMAELGYGDGTNFAFEFLQAPSRTPAQPCLAGPSARTRSSRSSSPTRATISRPKLENAEGRLGVVCHEYRRSKRR
jgi:hypothetical protein